MENNKSYKINLDYEPCRRLNEIVNNYSNYSIKKKYTVKIKKDEYEENAWHKVCAIMDRLSDTIYYLNNLELGSSKSKYRTAFDFYDFMNNAEVLIECIDSCAKLYNVDFSTENSSSSIFQKNGSDRDYFKYIRSLCSIHPVETSHYQDTFQDPNTKIECSPYVIWNTSNYPLYGNQNSDLTATVYTNNPDSFMKQIPIKIPEIFSYVEYRLSLLNKVVDGIIAENEQIITDYKSQPLEQEETFADYSAYLEYLKNIYSERIGPGYEEVFDIYKYAFEISFEDELNKSSLEKFKNAIKYSVIFLRSYLELLPTEDSFETTGCKNFEENNLGGLLFFKLDNCPDYKIGTDMYNFRYFFTCMSSFFTYNKYEFQKQYMLEQIHPLIDKYVSINETMDNKLISLLVIIASYMINLEIDSEINPNIPQDKMYRNINT